jgi:hypothetical protein
MSKDDYVAVDAVVIKTTEAAVLLGTDLGKVWVPRSVCEGGEDIDEGDEEVRIRRWKAEAEGLA